MDHDNTLLEEYLLQRYMYETKDEFIRNLAAEQAVSDCKIIEESLIELGHKDIYDSLEAEIEKLIVTKNIKLLEDTLC